MFKKLFKKAEKKEKASEVPSLSVGLVASIENFVGRGGVAPMPASAARAFQVATNPKAEPQDFVEVIESDEALSARVLRIANSVYFNRGLEVRRIEEAVVTIGVSELRGLLNASSLTDMFSSKSNARLALWENDVATGVISRYLGKRLSSGNLDFLFLAGLMHDIGKLFLLEKAPGEYEAVVAKATTTGKSFCAIEEEEFPFNHCEVGQFLGEKWNFSPDLIRVIRNHHYDLRDESFDGKDYASTRIVRAANCISHTLKTGIAKDGSKFREEREEELKALIPKIGMSTRTIKQLLQECKKVFEDERELYDL